MKHVWKRLSKVWLDYHGIKSSWLRFIDLISYLNRREEARKRDVILLTEALTAGTKGGRVTWAWTHRG